MAITCTKEVDLPFGSVFWYLPIFFKMKSFSSDPWSKTTGASLQQMPAVLPPVLGVYVRIISYIGEATKSPFAPESYYVL